ncbi:MAG: hypothetical protein H7Y00_10480 [Fimbriimonadaceae bacterium]|nr:hypothetical protein [Chitinophagales bacterium]
MRRLLFILAILSLTNSCNKDGVATITVNISIRNTESYHIWWWDVCSINETAVIVKQANHYELSEFYSDSATTNDCIFYVYKPDSNYIGSDYVEIMLHKQGNDELHIINISVND